MIYFLVNNDYHLNLDLKLAKQLTGHELGLIQVPYSLDAVTKSDVFSKIYLYPQRLIFSWYRILLRPQELLNIFKNVDNDLAIGPEDILLVHTELDMLNQYIIQKFYNAKARIYLVEDGTATMCYFSTPPQKAPVADNLRALILRKLYGFKHTKIKRYGIEILPVMDDRLFNGIILNFGDKIARNIPLHKLALSDEPIAIKYTDGAIFFNQALYFWFCTEDQYISYVDNLLVKISQNFTPFYFKFHPSETEKVRQALTDLINNQHKNISIISENDIAENLIVKYPVKYAITFNSTAVFNLMNRGIEPIFLNHIFDETYTDKSFVIFDQFLKSIDCLYPTALSEIKSGFKAFARGINNQNKKSMANILNG